MLTEKSGSCAFQRAMGICEFSILSNKRIRILSKGNNGVTYRPYYSKDSKDKYALLLNKDHHTITQRHITEPIQSIICPTWLFLPKVRIISCQKTVSIDLLI